MSEMDVIRAWKDPSSRRSLSPDMLAMLPPNPAGAVELNASTLKQAAGLSDPTMIITTAITCTCTYFGGCCPLHTHNCTTYASCGCTTTACVLPFEEGKH
jgi:mersacidin/lichenicidin family type 2 lantibiotic